MHIVKFNDWCVRNCKFPFGMRSFLADDWLARMSINTANFPLVGSQVQCSLRVRVRFGRTELVQR